MTLLVFLRFSATFSTIDDGIFELSLRVERGEWEFCSDSPLLKDHHRCAISRKQELSKKQENKKTRTSVSYLYC